MVISLNDRELPTGKIVGAIALMASDKYREIDPALKKVAWVEASLV